VDVPRWLLSCALVRRDEDGIFDWHPGTTTTCGAKWKEEDMVKTLWPSVWLTEDFPLSVDEFLPLPGEPRARRASAPRAAHHQVPTGDFPSKGNIALLLNKKPQNCIYFSISKFSG
jgi:ankyrin repeat domain-containing protein 13